MMISAKKSQNIPNIFRIMTKKKYVLTIPNYCIKMRNMLTHKC